MWECRKVTQIRRLAGAARVVSVTRFSKPGNRSNVSIKSFNDKLLLIKTEGAHKLLKVLILAPPSRVPFFNFFVV